MPRRQAPTSLRLWPVTAPLPGRGESKYQLPSFPGSTFQKPTPQEQAARPRSRDVSPSEERRDWLPPLANPGWQGSEGRGSTERESMDGRVSSFSALPALVPRRKHVRGPWDHSASISLQIDVESILPAPQRAAVNA
jgi:hypothetical protein